MNSLRKHAIRKSIYLLALGLSLIPGAAMTQTTPSYMEGKFTLTTEARCGTTVLPQGSYSISLDGDGPFAVITISNNKHVVATFITLGKPKDITTDDNVLNLVRMGGGPYFQSLDVPEFGLEFSFPVPKSAMTSMEVPTLP